jgi:Zn finger protein HypA/HybF involved in hydrogenase expression
MTGKIDPQSRRWIEAAKILAVNPKAVVLCPSCGKGTLQTIDARFDDKKIDRYMQCPVCHSHNVMTLVDPAQSGERQDAAESPKG